MDLMRYIPTSDMNCVDVNYGNVTDTQTKERSVPFMLVSYREWCTASTAHTRYFCLGNEDTPLFYGLRTQKHRCVGVLLMVMNYEDPLISFSFFSLFFGFNDTDTDFLFSFFFFLSALPPSRSLALSLSPSASNTPPGKDPVSLPGCTEPLRLAVRPPSIFFFIDSLISSLNTTARTYVFIPSFLFFLADSNFFILIVIYYYHLPFALSHDEYISYLMARTLSDGLALRVRTLSEVRDTNKVMGGTRWS
eukprot:gene1153-679_t